MPKYDHVGSVDVYRKRPEGDPWWLYVIGILIGLFLLGQCAG